MNQLPKGWKAIPLGELADFVFRGISYSTKVMTEDSSATPMVNLKNVGKGGGFREDGLKYYTGGPKKGVTLSPGDLLIANTDLSSAKDVLGSPIRIPKSLEGKGAVFTHHMTKISAKPGTVSVDYLQYFFESPASREFMKKHGSGTTVMNLQTRALPSLLVPVPPLAIQQRIVEILEDHLSRLDKAVEGLGAIGEMIRSLRRSYYDQLFQREAPIYSLGEVCALINGDRGINYPSKSSRTSQGVRFINAGHLIDGEIDSQSMDFISPEHYDLLGSGKVQQGDVLFCLRGSLGKTGLIRSNEPGAIASSLVILRPKEKILSEYLLGYFQTSIASNMITKFNNGTAQPNLSSKNLAKFEIYVPSMSDQAIVLEWIKDFELRMAQIMGETVRFHIYVENLRRSILHAAFTGQLTNEDSND